MKKSFVQLEFKTPCLKVFLHLFYSKTLDLGFKYPTWHYLVLHIVVVIFNCVVNYWLLPMYLNFSGLKKKSYCFCLFFIGCYFIFSLINTLIHVKIDQGIHYLVEEPITYACNFEKKNTIFGFSNHAKASEFCFRFRPFYYTTCLFLKSMYSIFVRSGGTHFSGYWHLLEATCLYLMC